MSVLNAPVYKAEGTNVLINGDEMLGVTSANDVGGASQGTIEITNLRSRAKEYTTELPDYGVIPLAGQAVPQSKVHKALRAAADSESGNETVAVQIIVGGRAANEAASRGSALTVKDNLDMTAAVTDGNVVFTASANDGINGVSDGDYIRYRLTSGSTDLYTQITNVALDATTLAPKFTTKLTSAITLHDTIRQAIVRPAIKQSFIAHVEDFKHNINFNNILEFTCNLRITGVLTTEVGEPTVSVS